MSKAFYVFLSELREDGYNAYALRQKKVDDLKLLYYDVTDREKKIYDHYIEKMKKHPLYKLKLPELQKMASDKGISYTGLAKVELIEALSPSNFIASVKIKQKKATSPSNQQKSVINQPSTSSDRSLLKMINQQLKTIDQQSIKKVTPPSDQPIKKVTPSSDKQKSVVKDQPSTSSDQSLLKMINHLQLLMIDQKITPPSDKQKSVVKDQPSTSSDKQKSVAKDQQKKVPSSDLVELTDEQKKVIDSLTDDGVSSIDVELLDAHYLEMINLYCKDVKTVKYHPVSCHLEATSEKGSLLIMGVKMIHQKKMINDRLMKAAIF